MKIKLLMSFVAIGVAGLLMGAGTFAYWVDQEDIVGNTFTAGKLDLEFGSTNSLPFSVSDIIPGDSGEDKKTLVNTDGSIDGQLDVAFSNLVQNENDCIEPEVSAGDPGGAGDLGLGLKMAMFVDVNQDGVYDTADGDHELEYSGNMDTTTGLQYARVTEFVGDSWNDILTMSAGDEVDLVIKWQLPSTWNYPKSQEIMMTDSLSFDILTSLEQDGGSGVAD